VKERHGGHVKFKVSVIVRYVILHKAVPIILTCGVELSGVPWWHTQCSHTTTATQTWG